MDATDCNRTTVPNPDPMFGRLLMSGQGAVGPLQNCRVAGSPLCPHPPVSVSVCV